MTYARRVALAAAVALGLSACTEVTQEPMPERLTFATFASPNIPTPNDLALAAVPTLPASAQKELLQAFVDAGGWPYDQEVSISIPFSAKTWNGSTYVPADPPPTVDAASVTSETVVLYRLNTGAEPTPVDYDAVTATPGRLVLRKRPDASGSRRWEPGARYFVAVRGGPSGVRAGGQPVAADTAVALAIPNRDLTKRENQPLGAIPDASNPPNGNADEIRSLEGVRNQLWNVAAWGEQPCPAPLAGSCWGPTAPGQGPAHVLPFPVNELATFTAFTVASEGATAPMVLIDAGSGVAPLPIDLLRTGPNGTIANNPAFGAAAAGIATLDGFSTTAMLLAQTSIPINSGTVNGGNVFLYAISGDPSTPAGERIATRVVELKAALPPGGDEPAGAGYVAQPDQISADCPAPGGKCSTVIGLQPAVPAPVPGVGNFWLPPLRSNTHYAVVITNRVLGAAGAPLAKPTVAKIILDFTSPPASGTPGDTTGTSLLSGVSSETARALRDIRANLEPVWAALPDGTTKADVVTAYTFKTQSVPNVSVSLGAAPYGIEVGAGQPIFAANAAPSPVTAPPGIPTTGVAGFFRVPFNSLDLIDKNTGAFRATLATDLTTPATIPTLIQSRDALVAVPEAANVPECGEPFPAGVRCAKLVVFGHGLNGSKETMFAVASGLAQAGFVTAAIDFPLHGARNWCRADADCTTNGVDGNGTCDKSGPFEGSIGQGDGDANRPGVCGGGSVPLNTGSRFFISANFFRTRDAFRQNVFDQSALTLALARPPTGVPQIPSPPGNPVSAILPAGVIVDPRAVYYEGISLGSIAGTQVVATMPRITRASLSVGGGTMVDTFSNSPAFQPSLDVLLAGLIPGYTRDKVTPGPNFDAAIAAAYLRTLNVAKWILDPGDPINYAQHVRLAPLPNLLANPDGSVAQSPKAVYGQIANGDGVVPNPFNLLLYNVMAADQTFYSSASAPGNVVPHSMLATIPQVQQDAAGFLLGAVPPTTRVLP